jgi:hypothetical protein
MVEKRREKRRMRVDSPAKRRKEERGRRRKTI